MTHNVELEKQLRSLSIDRSAEPAQARYDAGSKPSGRGGSRGKAGLFLALVLIGAAGVYFGTQNGLSRDTLSAITARLLPSVAAEPQTVAESVAYAAPQSSAANTVIAPPQVVETGMPSVVGSGHVIALRELAVGAQVNGRVLEIQTDVGLSVSANDVLVELDDTDARLALDVAKANLKAAEVAVAQARAFLAAQAAPVARLKTLVARGIQNVAKYEDAQLSLAHQEQTVKVAEARQHIARLQVAQARNHLSRHTVRAPFDGIVVARQATRGQVIAEMGQSGPDDTVLLTLVDTSELFVDVDVAERNVAKINPDGLAEVRLDAYPDRRFSAEVRAISARVSREKATVTVRLKLLPPDLDGVLVNMAAKVVFGGNDPLELSYLD